MGRHPGATAESIERARLMAALYRDGHTLEQIGQQFGITRERVRQLITEHHGLTAKDGGATVIKARKDAQKRARRDAVHLVKYGCTYAAFRDLRAKGAVRRFQTQKANAATRGIGWELTLWQWWSIWQESGRWEQRGRGQGYVMCRNGDVGPYAVGNVFIASAIENTSSALKKSDMPVGVRRNRHRYIAQRMIAGRRHYLGSFPTPELAHAAYLAAGAA